MQVGSKFTETKVPLGSGKAYMVKVKAKFAPPSGYCRAGCGLVQLTENNLCPICKVSVSKTQKTWDYAKERFDKAIQDNKQLLDGIIFSDFQDSLLHIPIKIGHQTLFVPLRYLKEYENIWGTDEKDYARFFEHLIKTCRSFKGEIFA